MNIFNRLLLNSSIQNSLIFPVLIVSAISGFSHYTFSLNFFKSSKIIISVPYIIIRVTSIKEAPPIADKIAKMCQKANNILYTISILL